MNLYVTNIYISKIGCYGNDSKVDGDIRTNQHMWLVVDISDSNWYLRKEKHVIHLPAPRFVTILPIHG